MIAVQRHIRNVLVLEAVVRRSERRTAVRADLDAFALRSNDNFCGFFWSMISALMIQSPGSHV